jgi:hypothetical protein
MNNNDLISRAYVLAEYDRQHKGPPGGARKIMEEAPAVDAEPVVHARPIWINPLNPGAKTCIWKCSSLCSACGDYVATGWKHCQNCGAKMNGRVDNGKIT